MQNYYYNFWDYWELRHKVTFDGVNKLILINDGVTNIDVQRDLYSSWKEWLLIYDNAKYLQAINTVGGEPTIGNQFLDTTYFLINGWKLKPWSGRYTLNIVGNIFDSEGDQIFISADDNPIFQNNININTNTSVIVRRIVDTAEGGGGISDEDLETIYNINDNLLEVKSVLSQPIEAYLESSQEEMLMDIQNKLKDLWLIHGLDSTENVIISKSGRKVGDIDQSFDESNGEVTVTRNINE